jgi:hypothetical protein
MAGPAEALAFVQKFDRFLGEIPGETPVIVIPDEQDGAIQSSYSSQEGVAWISKSYLDALDKATSFAAVGAFPTAAGGVVPGAIATLGSAESVREALAALIVGLETVPENGTAPEKLYSRKAVIGVSLASAFLAAIGAFAIGWARKPGPTSMVYPPPY